MNEVKFVNEVKKLEIKDGDVVVLKTDRMLKSDTLNAIRESVNEIFAGYGIKLKGIMILEDGMDIGVIEC